MLKNKVCNQFVFIIPAYAHKNVNGLVILRMLCNLVETLENKLLISVWTSKVPTNCIHMLMNGTATVF